MYASGFSEMFVHTYQDTRSHSLQNSEYYKIYVYWHSVKLRTTNKFQIFVLCCGTCLQISLNISSDANEGWSQVSTYFKFVCPPSPYANTPPTPENWNKLLFFLPKVGYIRSFDAYVNIRTYINNFKTHINWLTWMWGGKCFLIYFTKRCCQVYGIRSA